MAAIASRVLIAVFAVSAAASAADVPAPSAKEQALMEHACRSVQMGAAHEAYDQCLQARLATLRADFGPDLSKLSAPARAKIDAACRDAQTLRGREGYLDCLSAQLASLSAPPRAAAQAQHAAADRASETVPLAIESSSEAPGSPYLLVGAFAGVLIVIGTVGALLFFLFNKGQGTPHACGVCGAELTGSAGMCGACRRTAADTVRQAATRASAR